MTKFMPDTNIWIGVGRDEAVTASFEKAVAKGDSFVVAPPVLIELVRGLVASKEHFMEDQKTYAWIKSNHCEVLELPRIFMAKILRTAIANSGVRPDHYIHLMDMVVGSPDFDDFVRRCNSVGSVWKSIENLDKIHETEIETELRAMEDLARKRRPIKLAKALAMTFGVPGCRPVPIRVSSYFSAAIEYLESSIRKIVRGAKPRKNDRGMFVDWQLLNYLADPGLQFLTEENFSGEIVKSPQRHRIVKLEALN